MPVLPASLLPRDGVWGPGTPEQHPRPRCPPDPEPWGSLWGLGTQIQEMLSQDELSRLPLPPPLPDLARGSPGQNRGRTRPTRPGPETCRNWQP